jgi:hypothetical protein
MDFPMKKPDSIDAGFESRECQVPVSERAADDPETNPTSRLCRFALCDRLSFLSNWWWGQARQP